MCIRDSQVEIPEQAREQAQQEDDIDRLEQGVVRGKYLLQTAAAAGKDGCKPENDP